MLEPDDFLDNSPDQIIERTLDDHIKEFKRGKSERDNNFQKLEGIIIGAFDERIGRMDELRKLQSIRELKGYRDAVIGQLEYKRDHYLDMIEYTLSDMKTESKAL